MDDCEIVEIPALSPLDAGISIGEIEAAVKTLRTAPGDIAERVSLFERLRQERAEDSEGETTCTTLLKVYTNAEVKQDDEDSRVIHMIGSDETVDRDGDIMRTRGWDLQFFKQNPVILWAHNHREPPVGRAIKVVKDLQAKQLRFDIEFAKQEDNPFADVIFRLFRSKVLKASSVGFIPKEWKIPEDEEAREDSGLGPFGVEFVKQELLELSTVSIGSNRNALAASFAGACARGEFEPTADLAIMVKAAPDDETVKVLAETWAQLHTIVLASIATTETDNDGGAAIPEKTADGAEDEATDSEGMNDELLKELQATAKALSTGTSADDSPSTEGDESGVGEDLYATLFDEAEKIAADLQTSQS